MLQTSKNYLKLLKRFYLNHDYASRINRFTVIFLNVLYISIYLITVFVNPHPKPDQIPGLLETLMTTGLWFTLVQIYFSLYNHYDNSIYWFLTALNFILSLANYSIMPHFFYQATVLAIILNIITTIGYTINLYMMISLSTLNIFKHFHQEGSS